ncbi:MAG: hypothetical protein KDA81_16110 [Planctomycetaceae bacterium]|nr:hypothetical protein [Planctomycetaceae bacterium]
MRSKVVMAIAMTIAFSMTAGTEAEAARGIFRSNRPARVQRSSGGILSGLMDLERRKNAWLRSTFFGG